MITRMDHDIGRVLDLLEKKGLAENTLVIFTSDNGPQSRYGNGPNRMTNFFDSNGPLRGIKRDVFEGGVRVPMVAWWPKTVQPGTTDHVSAFQDIMPTFCELAGVQPPEKIDGISMVPTLLGGDSVQKEHDYLYWEFIRMGSRHGGRQGVLDVQHDYKLIRYGRNNDPALYNLQKDPDESRDIAQKRSRITDQIIEYLDSARTRSKLWPKEWLREGWRPRK
jgi:arylsulfatase A-like enzyme